MAGVGSLGTILTAVVTPFDSQLRVDEGAFVALMHHLAGNGSDGFVVAATTGEAATLTDEEQLALIELAVAERPPGKTIVAGAGTNDTRHAVHLTERASALGPDAIISVTPYYNRPSPLGLKRHYEAVAAATDRPVLLYNIPSRTGTNIGPELLAELAQIDGIEGVKQANADELQLIDGLEVYAGDDSSLARTLDIGGAGGVCVSSHIVGSEMRRMVEEPEQRAAIDATLQDVYRTLFLTSSPTCTKAALNLLGHNVGGVRLPMVEATPEELGAVRAMLVRHGLLGAGEADAPAGATGGLARAGERPRAGRISSSASETTASQAQHA
jgi:4-hydroxy-tetrahydrodipicolinate synthase